MEVKSKAYYIKKTGEGLCFTSEISGNVIEPTFNEDVENYEVLQNVSIEDIDYIELEYGTLAELTECWKSFTVDTETKELNIKYFSDKEMAVMEGKPIIEFEILEQIERLTQENADLLFNSAMQDIHIEQLQNDIADLMLEVTVGGIL